MKAKKITSLNGYLKAVKDSVEKWHLPKPFMPWFRGQADSSKAPIPSIFRDTKSKQFEFQLATQFRLKAMAFGNTPNTDRIDQWLILMQHHGVPTRLLDWTESSLIALFFALEKIGRGIPLNTNPGIWILNPYKLNALFDRNLDGYPNTWVQSRTLENFKIAFGTAGKDPLRHPITDELYFNNPTNFPIAIQPSHIHVRISSQKSCFTIHGIFEGDFEELAKKIGDTKSEVIKKLYIPKENVKRIFDEVVKSGITYSNVFPDLDNLANDLKYQLIHGV